MKDLRIVFFGTPDFAVTSLKALVEHRFNVVAVVTAPDKPAGRGQKLQASPVKIYAESQGVPVLQPTNLKDNTFLEELRSYHADLQIVVAFRMLPDVVWDMPELGTYNVHASLLPNYRGAAPINWAVINGEKESGVTTFKLQHEIDTGSILLQQKVTIEDSDDAGSLHDKLIVAGAELLVRSVQAIQEGKVELNAQRLSGEEKHAPKIFKETCEINWNQPAKRVRDFIRGLSPFPTAFTEVSFENGSTETWKLFASSVTSERATEAGKIKTEHNRLWVSCSDHWLEVTELQAPGKKRTNASDFLRGLRLKPVRVK